MNDRTIHIGKYYTSLEHIEKRFEKYGRQNPADTSDKESFESWRTGAVKKLWELLGMDKMEDCELKPELIERVELQNEIIREKVVIQTEPDVYMPMYILIPKKDSERKKQCIIAPNGHSGAGKYSIAGCSEIPAVKDKIEFFNYDYGLYLAQKGYTVICPDSRGFGERREAALQSDEEKSFINSTCFHLSNMAEPLGMTVIGMCVWDLIRITDYIEERNEWDKDNIGCVGFSGGGMQTLYFTALCDKVKMAVVSGYMYGFKEALLERNGNCRCNYVRGLWEQFDMGDIGALAAPRPFLIQSAREDHLNGKRGVINATEQVEIIREAYRLYGQDDKLIHKIIEGGHHFEKEIDEILEIYDKAQVK